MKIRINSTIYNAKKVSGIVEKRVPFNGGEIRLCELTRGTVKPNGLAVQLAKVDLNPMLAGIGFDNDFVIGNLTEEKAQEMLDSLCKNGYAEIVDTEFQKQPNSFEMKGIVFDNGASAPYMVEYLSSALAHSTLGDTLFAGGVPEGLDDDEEEVVDSDGEE